MEEREEVMFPIDNKYLYQDPNIRVSNNPLAAPQRPFDINAAEGTSKTKKDLKKEKKKDKNGKEIDDEEDDKPLPRPMGL